jgi:DNA-binding NarL/FixJ family response regulator
MEDLLTVNQCSPGTQVLMITAETTVQRMRRVMDYGVCSFLLKECEGDEVTDAVYATARGERFFCNRVVDVLLQRSSSGTAEQKCLPASLSRREIEIVERICRGQTANEIASGLFLSVHTVNTHRKNIFRKVGVRSNAELVYHAISTSMV